MLDIFSDKFLAGKEYLQCRLLVYDLLVHTGARYCEIQNLEYKQLSPEGTLTILQTKNDTERIVDLPGLLFGRLMTHYVLYNRLFKQLSYIDFYRWLKTFLTPDMVVSNESNKSICHGIRKRYIKNLYASGMTCRQIADFMKWKSTGTVAYYL